MAVKITSEKLFKSLILVFCFKLAFAQANSQPRQAELNISDTSICGSGTFVLSLKKNRLYDCD